MTGTLWGIAGSEPIRMPQDGIDTTGSPGVIASGPSRPFRIALVGLVGSRWMAPRLLHASLAQDGFDVKTVFFREDFEFLKPPDDREYELAVRLLEELEPDLIGLGFVSYFLRDAVALTTRIKQRLDTPVIWGGIHPSLQPEASLQHADFVCVGEGEEPLSELATSLHIGDGRTDIRNIWFRRGNEIIRNENRPVLQDLDKLPWADYSDRNKYFIVGHQVHCEHNPTAYQQYEYDTLTARGCPYICSFCVNHIKFGSGARLRRRSVGHVIGELKLAMANQPGLRKIQFWDDVFTYDKNWLAEFAPVYKKEIGLPFFCYVHPQMIARPQAKLLKYMGCKDVTMGIQHGSPKVRRELYDRYETNEQIIDAVAGMQEQGLNVRVDTIASILTENDEDNRANMDLLLQLPKPFTPSMHGMNYFPEYKLTKIALERGAIKPDEVVGQSSRRKVKVTEEEINRDPWLCYVSLTGKKYVPNGLIRFLIDHEFHHKRAWLLSKGTKLVLRGGRFMAAVRHSIPLMRRDVRSTFEVMKFVRANYTNR
jgi:radical SAM superfamily enzyme YgiQ (UPF0313 family)